MGWNSWDAYGTTVTEAEVKANADFMARRLKRHGWQYVVVDIQWSEKNPKSHGYRPDADLAMDGYGRLVPAENRFPSAVGGRGFKPLADYVHALGLRFGIHIMRGIPRQAVRNNLPVLGTGRRAAEIADTQSVCPWNTDMYGVDMSKPGAREYYDSIVSMYAGWGVDFIKADDEARPLYREEVAALHRAIRKSGRAIVLSLSPGPARPEDAAFLAENAQMWRVSDDLWDQWGAVRHAFELLRPWARYTGPGSWPDADMLPLGHIGIRAERGNDRNSNLTPAEQRTLMTLWSIARSPLMFGGDLPTSPEAAISLITNDEVLAVNQKAANSRELRAAGGHVVWASDAVGSGDKYVAVFNVGETDGAEVRIEWKDLGLAGPCAVRDLWEHKDLGTAPGGRSFGLPRHGAGLYRVSSAR
jgi:hypothetical protein